LIDNLSDRQLTGNNEAIFQYQRHTAEYDGEVYNYSAINSYKTQTKSGTSFRIHDILKITIGKHIFGK